MLGQSCCLVFDKACIQKVISYLINSANLLKFFFFYISLFSFFLVLIMPPFEEEGVYCFAYVGRSVVCLYTKRFPDDNLRMPWPRIMKLHTEVSHDLQMTPNNLEVSRSKVTGIWRSKIILS